MLGLLDQDGSIIANISEPTQTQLGPISLVERMVKNCRDLIRQNNIPEDQVKALGIGSPGPLSISKGKVINLCNLPGFVDFPLRSEMSQRLQIPALLENDANAACWGEFWLGAGRNINNMVLYTLGTGIGGGIIINGELVHGHDDNGAELGHMIIQTDGRYCACGQHGCVETYASANATAARAEEALDQGTSSSLLAVRKRKGSLTSKDVFEHAAAGDNLANEIVDGTCRSLAQVCVNMLHATEPEMIVLTGGMIKAGDILLDRVRSFFRHMIWNLKAETMEICYATLGDNSGFIGAAGLALDGFRKGHRLYSPGV